MLIGLAGVLCGFNGSFDFHSGAKYPAHVPYRGMRILMALPGVAMVPLAWGTAYELGFTWYGQHIVTLMVLCDLAWLVISRFVLLDSMLLFFTFTTVYCMAVFHNQQRWCASYRNVCVADRSDMRACVQALLARLVGLALPHWRVNWLCRQVGPFHVRLKEPPDHSAHGGSCLQRQTRWSLRHSFSRHLYSRRPLAQVWRPKNAQGPSLLALE